MIRLIEWVSNWAEQIIVAVVIATIIEMILPEGNNKKYIKAVIGVFILFTIIAPVIGKIGNFELNDIDYEKYLEDSEDYQSISQSLSVTNAQSIEEIYKNNLKEDMKNKLKEKGYIVQDIDLIIDNKDGEGYGNIKEITLTVYEIETSNDESKNQINTVEVGKIDSIKVGNTINNNEHPNKRINNVQIEEIKEYLSSVYEIKKSNISVIS